MKTHYELLTVAADAPAEEIKRAFRREISRYHPDKVQHLGPEFQEIAATRAAELTEAYRVLMDPEARAAYDSNLTTDAPPAARPAASPPPAAPRPAASTPAEPPPHHVPETLREARQSVSQFVRKAVIERIRDGVDALAGVREPSDSSGFDAVFTLRPRRGLFQKADPPVRLSVKVVDCVDAGAVEAAWPAAMRSNAADGLPCVLLCGAPLAPARELAAAVAEQRRRNRQLVSPILVPVDTRDWEALFPPDTPAPVRRLVERLKLGK